MSAQVRQYELLGFLLSLLGHIILFYLLVFILGNRSFDFTQPVVYSITLEGGKSLGGISQVPKSGEKMPIAPPKAVSAPPEKKEGRAEAKKDTTETAEVSLSEKKEPTPKPIEKKSEEKKSEEKKRSEKPVSKREPTPKPKPTVAPDVNKQYQQAMQRYLGESTDAGGKGFGAGKLGGSGMGGGVLRPPEFFQYRDLLKSYIKQGWRWYDPHAELAAWVSFKIAQDGTISEIQLAKSSGNREYDDSVLRAVFKANPVPPPPEVVYQFFREVRIEFTPGD